MISITINGVDYTANIGQTDLSVKDSKKAFANVKGGSVTVPPRSSQPRNSVKLALYYVSRSCLDTLNGLFLAGAPIPVAFNGLDLPSGNYVIGECTWQLVKVLTEISYNVSLNIQQDLPPQLPESPAPTVPLKSVAIVQKIGW